ncbi:MAG: histidine kinase [Bacteroidales bacterium]|jgi:signal transduction histidine kinase|nr:histidine kinase [Bacteroidales bacterium]
MTLLKKENRIPDSVFLRTMLSEFNRSLMLIADKELLIANTIAKIKQISPVKRIVFFLQNPDTEQYFRVGDKQQNNDLFCNVTFTPHSKLVNWLSVNETVFRLSRSESIMPYFSDQEQNLIRDAEIELIYPLKVMNRLSGLVFLGRRADDHDFTKQDIDLFTLLFDQAAFAVENTALYEEQSSRIKKMYRADRLAILGQLAAGAAHEIRNPLTAIRSTIQYMGKDIREPDKLEMMNELMEEVDRINKIVQGMLSFSKPSELETAAVNIVQLLRQSLTLLRNTIVKQQVTVHIDIRTKKTTVIADPAQLKQVFLNVILNAVEAMDRPAEKRLTLIVEGGRSRDYRSRYLLLSFTDTGKGIPENDIENVFNPFYTTKKDGTGLGLAISYGIVSRHGGEMEISSIPGNGTTVMIKLPQII